MAKKQVSYGDYEVIVEDGGKLFCLMTWRYIQMELSVKRPSPRKISNSDGREKCSDSRAYGGCHCIY